MAFVDLGLPQPKCLTPWLGYPTVTKTFHFFAKTTQSNFSKSSRQNEIKHDHKSKLTRTSLQNKIYSFQPSFLPQTVPIEAWHHTRNLSFVFLCIWVCWHQWPQPLLDWQVLGFFPPPCNWVEKNDGTSWNRSHAPYLCKLARQPLDQGSSATLFFRGPHSQK